MKRGPRMVAAGTQGDEQARRRRCRVEACCGWESASGICGHSPLSRARFGPIIESIPIERVPVKDVPSAGRWDIIPAAFDRTTPICPLLLTTDVWQSGSTRSLRRVTIMTTLNRLEPILAGLSEDRIRQLIDFARFLAMEQDRQEWSRFGQEQLARAYGSDEPDYSEADLRPGRQQ